MTSAPWKGKMVVVAALAAAFCLAIGLAFAQTNGKRDRMDDRQFLQDAADSSAWMVKLGEMALRQAASEGARDFGRSMIEDHGRLYRDLASLADRKGSVLEEDRDPVRRNTSLILSQEHGAAFDRNYISLMEDEHQRDAILYREEARKGRDEDVRSLAERMVGTLEGYARRARQILLDLPKPLLK